MSGPKSNTPWTSLSGLSIGGGRFRPDYNGGSGVTNAISSVYSAGDPLAHISTNTFRIQAQSITPQSITTTFTYPGLVVGDTIILNPQSAWSGPVVATAFCAADNTLTVVLSCASTLAQSIVATTVRATRLSFYSGF